MDMKPRILLFVLCVALHRMASAQTVAPSASYVDEKGNPTETSENFTAEAPLDVIWRANPQNMGEHTPAYEWHVLRENAEEGREEELLVRYEEDTQVRFTESGSFKVMLKTRLTDSGAELDSVVIKVTISESRLEFPNAFSPNDDGTNDIYGAKGVNDPESTAHYKSIVEFHAWIFNRWGQKLYEWTDVSKGWDGTYNGKPVKQGVYYVLVKAKGADGREYNIRKDVNLLRGYTETGNSDTGEKK